MEENIQLTKKDHIMPIEFEGHNVVFVKDQPEYMPLPAHRDDDGIVTTCWQLTPEDIEHISRTGKIYISQMTFNKPLQPINVFLDVVVVNVNDIKE